MSRRPPVLTVPPLDLGAVFRERLESVLARVRGSFGGSLDRALVSPIPSPEAPPGEPPVLAMPALSEVQGQSTFGSWVFPGEWPAGLPLPLSVGAALDLVEAAAVEWPAELEAEVRRCAADLVAPELLEAVLARRAVAERWPWPWPESAPAWRVFGLLLRVVEPPRLTLTPDGQHWWWKGPGGRTNRQHGTWPGEAAPLEVVRWAAPGLDRIAEGWGREAVEQAEEMGWLTSFGNDDGRRWPAAGMALLYLAEQEVKRERDKPRIAVDAGKPHHDLVSGWRDLVRERGGRGTVHAVREGDRYALLPKGKDRPAAPQLFLPFDGEGLHFATVKALRDLVKPEGLRHWTALLRLLSVEGGRRGWVRWTMAAHLDALGYSERARRDPETLDRVARQVELLTFLELALYDAGGKERDRTPLLHVGAKHDRLEGSAWRLDGMELRMNPWLYGGVRDAASGELGSNFFPVPVELARVDHGRYPYAHSLGLLLAMRWRWDLGDGLGELTLAGHNLLDTAGIRWAQRRAARIWSKLEHDLAELQRIGQLGGWTWTDGAPSRAGMCRLRPAEALLDRVVRGVLPDERPPADLPLTGAELRAWRELRAWSQAELARRIGVNQATVSRAEGRGAAALPPRLRDALTGA